MGHQTTVTESNATGRVRIKRTYEPAAADSYRVLPRAPGLPRRHSLTRCLARAWGEHNTTSYPRPTPRQPSGVTPMTFLILAALVLFCLALVAMFALLV
jgi:hypothetical protein